MICRARHSLLLYTTLNAPIALFALRALADFDSARCDANMFAWGCLYLLRAAAVTCVLALDGNSTRRFRSIVRILSYIW